MSVLIVVMVTLIMSDIKYFIFVLLCVLIGFAQGFWLLLNDAQTASSFTDVQQSYYTTFMFMFGQIDAVEMQNGKSIQFSKLYLVVFMLTMMLLLFNLLIALMGDSFSRTKEKIEAHYWKELASFMVDLSMVTPLLALLYGLGLLKYSKDDFIHVVKYATDMRTNRRRLGVNDEDIDDDSSDSDNDNEADIPLDDDDAKPSNDKNPNEKHYCRIRKRPALETAFRVAKGFIKGNASTDRKNAKLSKKPAIDGDIIHRSANKKVTIPISSSPTVTSRHSLHKGFQMHDFDFDLIYSNEREFSNIDPLN